MTIYLTGEFLERRVSSLITVPYSDWDIEPSLSYYQLSLKMCQLKNLNYGFQWDTESFPQQNMQSLIGKASKILLLDLSLNELTSLDHDGLVPFANIRSLDASLNRITSFVGIEVLPHLYKLNLSHNLISAVCPTLSCLKSLTILHLSMNSIEDISSLPIMVNLTVLYLDNNKLRSADGLQALPRLKELYIQRNQIPNLVSLSSLFHLCVLNAGDNEIKTLHSTVHILSQLRNLSVLNLQGNPIASESQYHDCLMNSTCVITLDNVTVRPQKKPVIDLTKQAGQNVCTLQDATRQAFEEQIKLARHKMEENVRFLQARIGSLQNEFQEYESHLRNDMDSCLRYLSNLSTTQVRGLDVDRLRKSVIPHSPVIQDDQDVGAGSSNLESKLHPSYSQVRDTDEVLRLAYKELSLEQRHRQGHL